MARTQDRELLHTLEAGFRYIENESFNSTFQGLFSEINLSSEKLGRDYTSWNAKLCTIITRIAEGIAGFSTDTLGDAYEYLIGQFAAGSGKKAGEFYTPQQISTILSEIVTLDCQDPKAGKSRYISTADPEPEIELNEVHSKLTKIQETIDEASKKHNAFLKELGLPGVILIVSKRPIRLCILFLLSLLLLILFPAAVLQTP